MWPPKCGAIRYREMFDLRSIEKQISGVEVLSGERKLLNIYV